MNCKVCKGALNGQETTCPHCGAELAVPRPAPLSKEPTFKEKILKRAKLLRVLSLAFGCAALLWAVGGLAALILNISALIVIYFFGGVTPGILLALAGLILGLVSRKDAEGTKSAAATVGIVLSSAALGGYLLYGAATFAVMVGSEIKDLF